MLLIVQTVLVDNIWNNVFWYTKSFNSTEQKQTWYNHIGVLAASQQTRHWWQHYAIDGWSTYKAL